MFYNFRPVKTSRTTADSGRLAIKLFDKAIHMQRKWADWMDFHTRRLPLFWLKTITFTIMFCTTICCICLLADGLSFKPVSLQKFGEAKKIWSAGLRQADRKKDAFNRYLDSMQIFHPKK